MNQHQFPQEREWYDWSILGLLQGIIPNLCTIYALDHITTGLTAIIPAATPLIVAALAHVFFADERLTPRRMTGVAIGFSGMIVLVGPGALAGATGTVLGVSSMILATISYAFGNLYVRSIPQAEPLRLAFGQQILAGFPALILALLIDGPSAFATAPKNALSLAALGLFATALPIAIYMNILKQAGPARGSMNAYLIPIWTVILGWLLLGESVDFREVTGGLIVLSGVTIVSLEKR